MPLPPAPKMMGDTVAVTRKKTQKNTASKAKREKKTEVTSKTKSISTPKLMETKSKAEKKEVQKRTPSPAVTMSKKTRAFRNASQARLFVLDTNVLLHDPTSIFRFEEHDVFLPMTTLEELDNHKTGASDVARNARQVSRSIDQLLKNATSIEKGVPLNGLGNKEALGKLFFQTKTLLADLPEGLPTGKADNRILSTVRSLIRDNPQKSVVLVTKDINMRIKAFALDIPAEDYFNDKTLDDTDLLYSGHRTLPNSFWEKTGANLESWMADGKTYYKITDRSVCDFVVNEFIQTEDGGFVAQVKEVEGDTAIVATIKDYSLANHSIWGINAKNSEQSFALNLLTDPDIDFVTILGQAGTGKTLLTLAAALSQTLDERLFNEIIFTRATVSVGEDIGYLPGTEEEKMIPWMGALDDNLEVLNKTVRGGSAWSHAAAGDLIRSRIKVKSMSFMRGRTFLNKFVIIDEAQNLSPKQMKTLITRAGPGTKIVCLGNIAQIDTPYLTEGSSGLTYVVDRLKGWKHAGHITLERGERSRLADFASDVL